MRARSQSEPHSPQEGQPEEGGLIMPLLPKLEALPEESMTSYLNRVGAVSRQSALAQVSGHDRAASARALGDFVRND